MSSRTRVLLIDDDADVAKAVAVLADRVQLELAHAASPSEAYLLLARERFDVVLLDLNFRRGMTSGEEGLACLERMLAENPDEAVVVITAHSGLRLAVSAVRAGAVDFVVKPWRNDDLAERIRAAAAHRRTPQPPVRSVEAVGAAPRILGDSSAIAAVRDAIRRIGPTMASTLILGRDGSGRTLAARVIHALSPMAEREPWIVDGRALLARGEAAAAERLAGAAGSTLILQRIDLLAEGEQQLVLELLPTTSRLIATAMSAAALTPTLRARVATLELAVPPLEARGDDCLTLARHFAATAAERHRLPLPPFRADAEAALRHAVWPDQVRGLALAVERAVLMHAGDCIEPGDLGITPAGTPIVHTTAEPAPQPTLSNSERLMVEAALRQCGFNVSRAADRLGISRTALYRRMTKYGL